MATILPQHLDFLNLPPEIRNAIYQRILLAGQPLGLHTSGNLVAAACNRPTTLLLATCKQILAEARPVFYSSNSFYTTRPTVFGHYLKATPRPLRSLQLNTIKHVVLSLSFLLDFNVTRIAELKRLKCLETLTLLEDWHSPVASRIGKYGIILDTSRCAASISNSSDADTTEGRLTVTRLEKWARDSQYTPMLEAMMLTRPHIRYEVVCHGILDYTYGSPPDPGPIGFECLDYMVTFAVSCDPEGERYVFAIQSMEENGRYLP
jgi:hypothetical protein